jgi:hypothetical protein
MPFLGSRLSLLGALTLAALPSPSRAQAVGSEFQINTYTPSHQETGYHVTGQFVGADASGNFVVVWESSGQDGSGRGVFGQRYDSEGQRLGSEFRVNSFTRDYQEYPSVAVAPDGHFVVVWTSVFQDGNTQGVFGQRYDSAGVAQGEEFQINSFTIGAQTYPSVASDASGNFVVVWDSNGQDGSGKGIFGQRYDSAGVPLGSEFRVNSYTTNAQSMPFVALDAGGNFVVAWHSYFQDGSYLGIFGQRYDAGGVPQGNEFRINSYTASNQTRPSVTSDASGNFVVVWDSYGQDGDGFGIFGQRYDSAGLPVGSEFRINSHTTNWQNRPSVTSDVSGNFVVVWQNYFGQPRGGIMGQRYDSGGVAQGDAFRVHSFRPSRGSQQRTPFVEATSINGFVVAWTSYGQDGSGFGMFGRRFDLDP